MVMATGMERLKFMQGEWDVDAHVINEEGEWISIPEPYETIIVPMNGGACHLEEMPVTVDGVRTRFLFSWSYDKFRHKYRMISCDDADGVMSVLEGNFVSSTDMVVISNLDTNTVVPVLNGKANFYRQLASTKISEDRFVDVLSESYDHGMTWEPVFRATHTRKPAGNT